MPSLTQVLVLISLLLDFFLYLFIFNVDELYELYDSGLVRIARTVNPAVNFVDLDKKF